MKKKLTPVQKEIMDMISVNGNYIQLGINGDRVVDCFGNHMRWITAATVEAMEHAKVIIEDKQNRTRRIANTKIEWK